MTGTEGNEWQAGREQAPRRRPGEVQIPARCPGDRLGMRIQPVKNQETGRTPGSKVWGSVAQVRGGPPGRKCRRSALCRRRRAAPLFCLL